jgi:hypothetical protein
VLSDRERETLREVERGLLTDDPDFARSFAARAQDLPRRKGGVGNKIFLASGFLLSTLVLAAGSLAGAAAFAVTTVLVWMAWRYGPDAAG